MAKKLTMKVQTKMTLAEGVEEFILNCEARNLRPGTIKHYKDSVRQIYKVVPPETPIADIDEDTWDTYKNNFTQKSCLK